MRCRNCQSDNPDGFRFCGHCGAALPAPPAGATTGPGAASTREGERRQLTVMFCDLVGSTALAERLDPEDLLEVVRRYQRTVAEVVGSFSGHVAQYLGDGLLVYFGYPEAHEDDPRRAVTSGLEIVAALEKLNASLEAERGMTVAVRIAIHTGDVVAAEIGAGEQLALGSTPNVAARVQALAQPGEVLLTGAAHDRVERYFACSSLGPQTLRGLNEPVVVFRALEPVRVTGPGIVSGDDGTPFVGRDTELRAILERYAHVRAGRGQVVLINGEPGLGKSRLQTEVRSRLNGGADNWHTCGCSPYYQNRAFHAVTDLLERLVAVESRDDAASRRAKLEARLATLGLGTDALRLLAPLLALSMDGPPELTPDRWRQGTLELLPDLVVRLARSTPAVMVVEDLHWADPSTLDFLRLLVDRISAEPVLAIFTCRTEFTAPWPAPPHQIALSLERLTERDAERMIGRWRVGRRLPQSMSREVVARADGVPLFLEELTRTVAETAPLIDAPTPSRRAAGSRSLIPATLRDSLTARLDRLGAAKEVTQLGALLGRTFRYEMLAAISTLDDRTLDDHLSRVVETGLLVPAGEAPHATFVFKHALIQESAYDSMLRTRRRDLHARVADTLAERFPDIVAHEPETVARHCEEAGRFIEAADAWERAATRASERWAYVEASRGFRKALSMLERIPPGETRDARELALLVGLRHPLTATEGYTAPDLPAIHRRIRQLARGRSSNAVDECALVHASWGFHCVHGDRRETLAARDEVIEAAARSDSPVNRVIAGWVGGATDFYDGNHAGALAQLTPVVEAHLAEADATYRGDRLGSGLFILAWVVQGWSLAFAGQLQRSVATLADAVADADRHGGPFDVTQALCHQAAAAIVIGLEPDRVRAIATRTLALSGEHALPQTLYLARSFLGWAAAVEGDDAGIAEMREALDATRAMGNRLPVANLLALLADGLARLGRHDDALVTADEAQRSCAKGIARYYEPLAHQLMGELTWRRGDIAGAEAHLQRALEIAVSQGARTWELRAAVPYVRLLRETGRAADGATRLARACAGFEAETLGSYLADARSLLDQLQA